MNKYEQMAKEIYEWCVAHEVWDGCVIYFNGKAWDSYQDWGFKGKEFGKKIGEELYEFENKNPKDYFKYANPNTLSMAFDGSDLYYIFNAFWEDKTWLKWHEDFHAMFDKYNGYIELGNSWNFTFVED